MHPNLAAYRRGPAKAVLSLELRLKICCMCSNENMALHEVFLPSRTWVSQDSHAQLQEHSC